MSISTYVSCTYSSHPSNLFLAFNLKIYRGTLLINELRATESTRDHFILYISWKVSLIFPNNNHLIICTIKCHTTWKRIYEFRKYLMDLCLLLLKLNGKVILTIFNGLLGSLNFFNPKGWKNKNIVTNHIKKKSIYSGYKCKVTLNNPQES